MLNDSPMASAALSRRALQQILRDEGGYDGKKLAAEIQQAIDSKTLPSYVIEILMQSGILEILLPIHQKVQTVVKLLK